MDLSKVNFTKEDVQDFMDSLDIDTILKNIDRIPSDDNYESSFSHDIKYGMNK